RLRALIGPFKALLARLTRGWYPRRASGPEAVARHVAVVTGLLEKPRKTPADYRAIELQVRALGARVHEGGALEGPVTVMNREEVWRKPPLLALVLAQIERGAPALPLRDALETLTARLPTYVRQEVGAQLAALVARVREATQAAWEARESARRQAQAAAARAQQERALALRQEAFREAIGRVKEQCARLQGRFDALRAWAELERARRHRQQEEETAWSQRHDAEQRWRERLEAAERAYWQEAAAKERDWAERMRALAEQGWRVRAHQRAQREETERARALTERARALKAWATEAGRRAAADREEAARIERAWAAEEAGLPTYEELLEAQERLRIERQAALLARIAEERRKAEEAARHAREAVEQEAGRRPAMVERLGGGRLAEELYDAAAARAAQGGWDEGRLVRELDRPRRMLVEESLRAKLPVLFGDPHVDKLARGWMAIAISDAGRSLEEAVQILGLVREADLRERAHLEEVTAAVRAHWPVEQIEELVIRLMEGTSSPAGPGAGPGERRASAAA
ncbi:MAG: hypothetical protein HYV08_18300, partial [Deltaproteobacteria bacterium]|nr:hypothetical protein [Deltaproteobacteria bacterium]